MTDDATQLTERLRTLRREYVSRSLDESSVSMSPYDQFNKWMTEAISAEQPDAEAMTLSSATKDGFVSARIVLLKGVDERGFVFFTNYESRKSRELIENPQAALTFYWHTLNRQVRIEGVVTKVSRAESEDYFNSRPEGSKIAAWASPQSDTIIDRNTLETKVIEIEEQFKGRNIPCPPFWGGFRVSPVNIEFWQGQESRLHDRIVYIFVNNQWDIHRLAP